MASRLNLAGVVGIAAVAMIAGIVTQRYVGQTPSETQAVTRTATVVPGGKALPEFSLQRSTGTFTNGDLDDHWSVVFFGFTNCPDICPTTLDLLTKVARVVRVQGVDLQVVFVSIDSGRDSAADAERYAQYFDAQFVGVAGADDALRALTEPLGILYIEVPDGKDSYTMDHSTALLLINPQGQLHAVFGAPHVADDIAADVLALTGAAP